MKCKIRKQPAEERVSHIQYAESLGGVESLITYPMLQTHADVFKEQRETRGINDRLLRFSVGLESSEDLITNLTNAMEDSIMGSVFDFDTVIERKNTNSLKYDFAVNRGRPDNLLPLWVADMDFQSPPSVIEALEQRSSHGIFGYSDSGQEYFNAVQSWMLRRHGWKVQQDWMVETPGVVFAICTAIRALTKEGDSILIQQPVYYPFQESISANNRKLTINELIYQHGKYSIDFEDFEKKIVSDHVKLFILCSPHNPVGRVWTEEELTRMGDICLRHNVIVVADEIHMDFIYSGSKHSVFADLKPEYLDNTILCTAPSKTFNLAGLQASNIFIPNRELRKAFQSEIDRTGFFQLNLMGLIACRAAYEGGEEWLDSLLIYLTENLQVVRDFLCKKLPRVRLVEPEGTYLVWLDFRDLHLTEEELEDLIVKKARLWLDRGTMFGESGKGFQRINIACPRAMLYQALTQLEAAING